MTYVLVGYQTVPVYRSTVDLIKEAAGVATVLQPYWLAQKVLEGKLGRKMTDDEEKIYVAEIEKIMKERNL